MTTWCYCNSKNLEKGSEVTRKGQFSEETFLPRAWHFQNILLLFWLWLPINRDMKTPFFLVLWSRIPREKPPLGGSSGGSVNARDGVGEKERGRMRSHEEETKRAHSAGKSRTSAARCSVINHLCETPTVPSPIRPPSNFADTEGKGTSTNTASKTVLQLHKQLALAEGSGPFLKLCMESCMWRERWRPHSLSEPGDTLRTFAVSHWCW